MSLIDTHCHLDILAQRGVDISTALANAAEQGVTGIIQIATDLDSSLNNLEICNNFKSADNSTPEIFFTAGLHPGSIEKISELPELLNFIEKNHTVSAFVGVGETGLDYYHRPQDARQQQEAFELHLECAARLNLPVILHLRDGNKHEAGQTKSVDDALAIIKNHSSVRGVLHCFTYGYEEARPFVDLGWLVSYSGVLTFNNAKSVQAGALKLPLDALLVETDAPFLAPAPQRGKNNEPGNVIHVLNFLAELRQKKLGEDPTHIKKTIFENSQKLINWKTNHA